MLTQLSDSERKSQPKLKTEEDNKIPEEMEMTKKEST